MPSRMLAATMKLHDGASPIEQRHRQRHQPTEHQQPLAPDAVGERPGGEVGDRLGQAERDHEGEDGRGRGELEVALADQRQDAALEPDHPADERVERDQQRELRCVRAQAERRRRAHRGEGAAPRRLCATIASCSAGRGGVSSQQRGGERVGVGVGRASCSVLRSKPIEENGLAESERPQTDPA